MYNNSKKDQKEGLELHCHELFILCVEWYNNTL